MYNIITGQCTEDIIEVIRLHNVNLEDFNKSEFTRNSNIHFNRERRFEFNHNFNRNNYVKRKH